MKRFLEYEKSSGRIICEVYAENVPQVGDGHAVLEIGENMTLDTNNSAVRDGVVVRLYETPEERREREKLRREYKEKAHARVRHLLYDFLTALIEDNEMKIEVLKEEYRVMKRWM